LDVSQGGQWSKLRFDVLRDDRTGRYVDQMPPGTQPCSAARRSLIVAVALACLIGALVPASAMAMAQTSDGDLSARLAELARPSVRIAPPDEQAAKLSVASDGPGSLLREGNRVLVDVRFGQGAAAGVEGLREAGARVLHVSRQYQTVTVAVRPADLRDVADVARVGAVTEVLAPIVSAVGPVTAATSCAGAVTSEGDAQLGAGNARSAFNIDGAGTTVGILSDSFDRDITAPRKASADVASGDLPGPGNPCGRSVPVRLLDDSTPASEATDEGRGMAQIVHDLAPGASIAFATAFTSLTAFADNIRRLAKPVSKGGAGAQVIVDDVVYLEEPFFQDGPVAAAVNEVAAAGVAHFSSAGNNNLFDKEGNEIASWEAPEFRDSGACPASLVAFSEAVEKEEEEESKPPQGLKPDHCLDFDPDPGAGQVDDDFGITVEKDETLTVDVQWAEPWFGVNSDIDAFAFDSSGESIAVSGDENISDSERPYELLSWENDTGEDAEVQLVINRYGGPGARIKFVLLRNGGGVTATEYPQSSGGDVVGPTIFGHNGAKGAVSVGAVLYKNSSMPEPYSSRGPVTHYFGPVVGTAPALPIPKQTIGKPDLVATDGVATTFFGQLLSGVWRFFGTSAAAPHAAAVAALVREANPTLSTPQVRTTLASTARLVGAFGPNAVGAGLVDAYGAVSSVALPPTISITERPASLGRNRTPTIGFAANRPASFSCTIDEGSPQPCISPFVPKTPLADGEHGFVVSGTDLAGRTGTSELVLFKIDSRRPRTFFRAHPRRVIRTRHRRARAVFRFGSNEADVTFICRVDGGLYRFCGKRLARRFRIGRHDVRVKASDKAGNIDDSPAVYRFRVKRRGQS
jgi:hypothetical protein